MSKITFPSVATLNAVNVINSNFALIATALQNNVLYRLNIGTEPNALGSDLDTNGKRIYNLPSPTSDGEPITLGYANSNLGANIPAQALVYATAAAASALSAANSVTAANTAATNSATSAANSAISAAVAAANSGSNNTAITTAIELDVASAATVTIGGLSSNKVRITGTTTINSLGIVYNGPVFIRFAGALTLTHNAGSLILPGGINITTAAGDNCIAVHKATSGVSDGWQIIAYQKASAGCSFAAQFSTVYNTTTTTPAEAVGYSAPIFNKGSAFNSTTGRFTAPCAGTYIFNAVLLGITGNLSTAYFAVNGNLATGYGYTHAALAFSTIPASSFSSVILLSAGDYVSVWNNPEQTGGSQVRIREFSGALLSVN